MACAQADEAPADVLPSSRAAEPADLPGAISPTPELARRLREASAAKGPTYEPRTEHRHADGSAVYVNRLILEDSPYLLQHAHNPVDWYPWGPEAFEKARREGKPIFLSIGYSTCHWCHVMERESFDDVEVARALNEGFVSIKVDREQRPDVDEVYMTAVQLLTGSGGWPMSTLLTPDGKPFFGGTYFPRAAFLELLRQAGAAWRDRRPELLALAGEVAAAVARATAAATAAAELDDGLFADAVQAALSRYDPELGGFSGPPKFPHEPELLFLLERATRVADRRALAAVATTLDHMARGGIYDQVAGGFHRYSTDARWLVPHFEKMLYNQAQLARAYLEAWRLTGNPLFERVARQTLDYVLRDMTSAEGGFASATDADSEGREGTFFLWTPAEIRAALPAADADLALRLFGVTESGNFEGRSILHMPRPLPDISSDLGIPLTDLLARLDVIRERLYEVRERRVHPLRDEKVLTEWNAMMITALAEAGASLGEVRYLEAARRAAGLLWERSRTTDGGLRRDWLAGRSSIAAAQSDYASLCEALLALYDATADATWLGQAREVADEMLARFWDDEAGGFFLSEDDHGGRLPTRPKSPMDGATPSGNSVAVRALARLAARTGEEAYRRRAEATLAAFSGEIQRAPTAFGYLLAGADDLLRGTAGPLAYGARGAVRAEARPRRQEGEGGLEVVLDMAPGWHINASRPLQEALIATRLELAAGVAGAGLGPVAYPEPERLRLGFQEEPLAVYRGRATIRASLSLDSDPPPPAVPLMLTLQACDDRKCLEPETLTLELPVAGFRGSEP